MTINPKVIAAVVSYDLMSTKAQYVFVMVARRGGAVSRDEVEQRFEPEAVDEVLAMGLADERNGDIVVHDLLRESLMIIKGDL